MFFKVSESHETQATQYVEKVNGEVDFVIFLKRATGRQVASEAPVVDASSRRLRQVTTTQLVVRMSKHLRHEDSVLFEKLLEDEPVIVLLNVLISRLELLILLLLLKALLKFFHSCHVHMVGVQSICNLADIKSLRLVCPLRGDRLVERLD